ncbi:MAG: Clp protease-domain-containing protein [Monoraphidium minutum]|nr:MAG: Clp protease-domain-containing protein [Monoraphidium minutum]
MSSSLRAHGAVGSSSSSRCIVRVNANLTSYVGVKSAGTMQRLCKQQKSTGFWQAADKQINVRSRGGSGPRRRVATMMPVAAPKVLMRPPGQRQFEWVDMWEAYTMNKVVFVKEPVTEDSANSLMALTLYLDSVDKKRIYYWLNCPGGEVVPTLALYDTMQYVRSPTATVGYGMCLGMGGFLLACGGEKGYRYAMPHSILMMHHPSGAARGQASDIQIEARELVRMRDYLSLLVSDHTGQPYDRVIRELSRNKWMNPKEAIEYGMIDKVLTTPTPKMPQLGPKFKFERSDAAQDIGV